MMEAEIEELGCACSRQADITREADCLPAALVIHRKTPAGRSAPHEQYGVLLGINVRGGT